MSQSLQCVQLWLLPVVLPEAPAAAPADGIERWSDIDEFPSYQCSTMGRFRNVRTGRLIRGTLARTGYIHINLTKHGKQHITQAHRVIAKTFLGTPSAPADWVVDHVNRDRTDNRLANLEWVTRRENALRYIAQRNRAKLRVELIHSAAHLGNLL